MKIENWYLPPALRARRLGEKIKSAVADVVFPLFCSGCGKEGSVLCEKCVADAMQIDAERCPMCTHLSPAPMLCSDCREKIGVKQLVHLGQFKGPLREALHNLKYEDARIVAQQLSSMLAGRTQQYQLQSGLVVPMPLAQNRNRERGYNQSALIARELSNKLNWDYLEALERVKKTAPQTKLSRAKRKTNVKGAFASKYKFTDPNRIIYLLDDVVTTGATLSAAVTALKKAGAKKITALVVAVD